MADKKDNLLRGNPATQFPHNDPTKGGRKPKIYTILKDKGYSKDDIKACFGELAFYTQKELQEVIGDKELPIIQQIVANQFLEAFNTSDWNKIKEILEHSLGRPKQEIDQKNTNVTPIFNINNLDKD